MRRMAASSQLVVAASLIETQSQDGKGWKTMGFLLTENDEVGGTVDCSVLFSTALPDHRDLQVLGSHLLKPLHQRYSIANPSEDEAEEPVQRASSKVAR